MKISASWKISCCPGMYFISSCTSVSLKFVFIMCDCGNGCVSQTFLRWVNYKLKQCSKHVSSLQEDFRDGVNLCALLEVLSGVALEYKETCQLRGERMNNILTALSFMSERAGINTLGWDGDEVERGYLPTIQAIIYALITRFELCIGGSSPVHAKQFLLEWVKSSVAQHTFVKVTNIKNSFQDGMTLCALVARYLPGKLNLDLLDRRDTLTNTQLAIHLAEENSVPALLDAMDLVATSQKKFDEGTQSAVYEVKAPSVDEFSLVVYLSMLYQVFTGQTSASLLDGKRRRKSSSSSSRQQSAVDREIVELRVAVEKMSRQVKSLEADRDKALFVAKELRKFIEELKQKGDIPSARHSTWTETSSSKLELQVMRQEKLLVASNSAVLRGLQMLRREEGVRQTNTQLLLDNVRKDAEKKNDETLAACHARYEQLLMASRQECQRLHELNDRLLEQLEERDKMIRSMQKEMSVLIGVHRPGRGGSATPTNGIESPTPPPGAASGKKPRESPANGRSNGMRTGAAATAAAAEARSAEEKAALTSTYSTPRSVMGSWHQGGGRGSGSASSDT
ncbi:alpha-actinin-2-like isoform X1 [Sycon ciliatum]|uniref:alpha-actinin-2-like isoform X1 n=1 Tax=Sycon ciliatum TaxID=27933 RepID=UPI0031F6B177